MNEEYINGLTRSTWAEICKCGHTRENHGAIGAGYCESCENMAKNPPCERFTWDGHNELNIKRLERKTTAK